MTRKSPLGVSEPTVVLVLDIAKMGPNRTAKPIAPTVTGSRATFCKSLRWRSATRGFSTILRPSHEAHVSPEPGMKRRTN